MSFRISEICNINANSLTKNDDYQFINYLDTANLTDGKIEFLQYMDKSKDKIPSRAKRKVQKNDILLSTVRPNQRHYGIIKNVADNMIVSTGFAVLTTNTDIVSPDYLYKYLTQEHITTYLHSIAESSTSTYPSIKPSVIGDLQIELPLMEEQKKIGHILSALDEKIEVNNQVNKTLENMAQAIFKQWFVDFEFPNEDGEPYQSSGGEMVESELGMIPKGWEVSELEKIINIKHGYAFKSEYFSEEPTGKVLLTPGNFKIGGGFKDDKLKYYAETVSCPSDYVLEEGELLLTMTDLSKTGDTLGYPIITPRRKYIMLHNQRLGRVELKDISFPKEYLYYLFCTREYRGFILGSATGTTVKHTAPKRIMAYKVALPDYRVLSAYSAVVSSMIKLLSDVGYQNEVLASVRDSLLPKLMSGEIRVPLDSEGEAS